MHPSLAPNSGTFSASQSPKAMLQLGTITPWSRLALFPGPCSSLSVPHPVGRAPTQRFVCKWFFFSTCSSALPCRFVRRASSIYYLQLAHFDLGHQDCHNFPDGAFAGLLGVVSHQLVELQIDSCPTMFKVGCLGSSQMRAPLSSNPLARTAVECSSRPRSHHCPSQSDFQQGQGRPAEALTAAC